MKPSLKQEKGLLMALAALLVLLNVPFGPYLLYPFAIFSTWIHELCHGLAALALGGGIERLQIFSDTSGLALTTRPATRLAAATVASAGYLGTSLVGAGLLWMRHATWTGPFGLPAIGSLMVLTALLWVRNPFGFVVVVAIGVALIVLGRLLARQASTWLFTFLAATCCLNAVTSIRALFSSELIVAGRPAGRSDAQSVAEALWLPHWFWAAAWIMAALALVWAALRRGDRDA